MSAQAKSDDQGTQDNKDDQDKNKSPIGEIHAEVKKLIDSSNDQVKKNVAEHLAQQEIKTRETTLLAAIAKKTDLERALVKASKPDVEGGTWDETKKEVVAGPKTFSKAALELFKKAKEERDNFDRVVEAALKADASQEAWNKLKEKVGKGGAAAPAAQS